MGLKRAGVRVLNISLAFLLVSSLFLVDFSSFLPNNRLKTTDSYAQNINEVKMYFDNAPLSLTPGMDFSVNIKLDSSSGINAVQSDISYPTNLLQVMSIDTTNSDF